MQLKFASTLIALTLAAAAQPAPVIVGASGPDAAAIRTAVQSFQNTLGPLNAPGATGDANGRREINWDGVPAQFSAPNLLPNDFFNKNSVRGAVFSVDNPGWTGFQVFTAADPHPFFSPEKLFVSIGTNDYNVDFFVPGTTTKGKVRGFGIVFSNVALPFNTSIELYNIDGLLLGRFFAPVAAKGLSFIGVTYQQKMIHRVRVVPGNAAFGATDDPANNINVVAIDDLIYGEPASDCAQ
jgi:hypothetical protein